MNNNPSATHKTKASKSVSKLSDGISRGLEGQFSRITALRGGGNHITFIQAFVRAYVDYLAANNIKISHVEAMIKATGKINVFKRKLSHMASGSINPYTYTYSLDVMAKAVGRNMMDFISVHQPDEKEAVRAVIKNPDLM